MILLKILKTTYSELANKLQYKGANSLKTAASKPQNKVFAMGLHVAAHYEKELSAIYDSLDEKGKIVMDARHTFLNCENMECMKPITQNSLKINNTCCCFCGKEQTAV